MNLMTALAEQKADPCSTVGNALITTFGATP